MVSSGTIAIVLMAETTHRLRQGGHSVCVRQTRTAIGKRCQLLGINTSCTDLMGRSSSTIPGW